MNYLAQVKIGETFLGGGFLSNLKDVGQLVSIIISTALVISGIILLFLFVFAGISIIAGSGNQNPEQMAKGRQAATTAVIGFIIIFTAYWIVLLIGRLTGINLLGPTL